MVTTKRLPAKRPAAAVGAPVARPEKTASVATKPLVVQPPPSPKATGATLAAKPKATKVKKPKLVRDSFTIPKPEYETLEQLKLRSAKLGQVAKKSELLRAGIKALSTMTDAALLSALKSVPAIKTGRPAKS